MGGYIRLLRLFETHLREYHKVFDNDYYKISYIIQRERCTDDAEVKITLTILEKTIWMNLSNESDNLKQMLESYSMYFSVSDITIVRPYLLKQGANEKNPHQIPPIEERVSFNLYVTEVSWREIQRDYV